MGVARKDKGKGGLTGVGGEDKGWVGRKDNGSEAVCPVME